MNGNLSRKSQNFPTSCILRPPTLNGFLGISYRCWGQNKNDGATGPRKKLTISSAMWIQYTNTPTWQTDRQTDGHRTTVKTSFTHSVAR